MRYVLLIAGSLLLAACVATGIQKRADNEQIVQGIYAAFAEGDIPAVLNNLADDVRWVEAEGNPYADNSPYVGPDAVAGGLFARLGSEWAGFSATPSSYIADEDQVVALGRYGGTYKASGTGINAQFAHVWTLEDGNVVAFQQYADTAQLAAAMVD